MLRRQPSRIELKPEDKDEYEESRKAHIRKLQNDLARANADSLDNANRFQFNAGEPTKEERIGLNR